MLRVRDPSGRGPVLFHEVYGGEGGARGLHPIRFREKMLSAQANRRFWNGASHELDWPLGRPFGIARHGMGN